MNRRQARPSALFGALLLSVSGLAVAGPAEAVDPDACDVAIVGTAAVDEPLTAVPTESVHYPIPRYDWRYAGSTTQLSSTSTYWPSEADFGRRLQVEFTSYDYANTGYTLCSAVSSTIGRSPTTVIIRPVAAGMPRTGRTLVVMDALSVLPAGATASYQWIRVAKQKHHRTVSKAIRGATAETYKLRQRDKGNKVAVQVTLTAPSHLPTTVTSARRKIH